MALASLSKEGKNKADTALQVQASSQCRWASRWILLNSRINFPVPLKPVAQVLLAHSLAVIRRPLCGTNFCSTVCRNYILTRYRMGELEPWIDENFVRSVWFGMGYQVNVKMIRDKFSG
jgi:hypothetical protein